MCLQFLDWCREWFHCLRTFPFLFLGFSTSLVDRLIGLLLVLASQHVIHEIALLSCWESKSKTVWLGQGIQNISGLHRKGLAEGKALRASESPQAPGSHLCPAQRPIHKRTSILDHKAQAYFEVITDVFHWRDLHQGCTLRLRYGLPNSSRWQVTVSAQ